jgi:DNA-binding PadR family transcriptional regulator
MPHERHGDNVRLTEHEGRLLALVLREEPVTAYQLLKIFRDSPIASINASKGQLYPAIARLKAWGLLEGSKLPANGRKGEDLRTTLAGRTALREWMKDINVTHVASSDGLGTRVLSFDLFTQQERLDWIVKAKTLVRQHGDVVEEYYKLVDVPYEELAHRCLTEVLRVKMEWLDELLGEVVSSA